MCASLTKYLLGRLLWRTCMLATMFTSVPHSLGAWTWLVWAWGRTCPGRVSRPSPTCREKHTSHKHTKPTTKSTMVKLGAPKVVGLPKPPQISAKVRELVIDMSIQVDSPCSQKDRPEQVHMHTMHVLLLTEWNPLIDVIVLCEWRWDVAGWKWHKTTDAVEKMRRHQ